ncbi:MAG TPA: Ger(x)C family spore germination protein [Firmicutes bacterium]|jgi:spore germination protein KC|nr:Ger(x)C family spore germination protein [Bacillota bacterium]
MKGRFALLTLLLLGVNLLSGCAGIGEIDETAFVFTITFDKGEKAPYQIGTRIPVPRLLGRIQGQLAFSGDGQEPYINTQVQTHSLAEALVMTQLFTGREVSLDHARTIIISEDLARESIEDVCQPLLRGLEIRGTTLLYISRGNAFRFINENKPLLEVNTSKFIELVSREQNVHGLTTAMPLNLFYSTLATEGAAVIPLAAINETVLAAAKAKEREPTALTKDEQADREAKAEMSEEQAEETGEKPPLRSVGSYLPGSIPRSGGNPIDFIGLAVFRNDKMVGVLDGNSALVYNMLRNNFHRTIISVKMPRHPDETVSLLLYKGRPPRIRVEDAGTRYKISVELVIDCDMETVSTGDRIRSVESLRDLETAVEKQLQQWVETTISMTQEWGADIFGFGNRLRSAFLTWDEWTRFNWSEAYKHAEVSVVITANLRRTGLIIGTY